MASSARDILENYLLLDKSIILEFPSESAFKNTLAALSVYRGRIIAGIESIGECDPFEGKTIRSERITGKGIIPIRARIYLGIPEKPTAQFILLASEDITPDEQN